MDITKRIADIGIIPVVKINEAEKAAPLCRALVAGGLPLAEITFRTEAAEEAIRLAAKEVPEALIGAGTVTSVEQADRAMAAGARFIVTPGFNPAVVRHCIDKGYPIYPGCPTTSDIELAREMGLRVVKFFPAEAMGGVKTIQAVSAPYPEMRFIPTGGVSERNLGQYTACKKVAAVGGSWMVPADLLDQGDYAAIEALTRGAVAAMHGFCLHHVAFNCGGAQKAEETAKVFMRLFGWPYIPGASADHAGGYIETMKGESKGAVGHIAVGVNDMARARAYLEAVGVPFAESAKPHIAWLEEEVFGFAIQLIANDR